MAKERKTLCSKCCKEQPYEEKTIPIKYGFNDKESVLIDGIERVCAVCGWAVDNIETTEINHQIALKMLKESGGQKNTENKKEVIENTEEIAEE